MAILVTLVLALVPGQRVKLVAGWVGGAGWGWEGWHATGLAGWRGWRPSPAGTTSCPASQVPHSATAPIIFLFFSFNKISLESFEENARKLVRTGRFRQNVCEEAWGWIREIDKLSFWGNSGDTNEVKASLRCFRLFLRSPSATTSVWVSGCSSCLHSQLWYECPTPTSAGTPAQTLGQLKSKSAHKELSCAWSIVY